MRFWLLVITVAVVGFGLGTGVAYGRHALKGGSPAQQQIAASPGPAPAAPTASPTPQRQDTPAAAQTSPNSAPPTATSRSTAPPTPPTRGTAAPGRTSQSGQAVNGTIAQIAGDSLVVTTRQGQTTVTLGPATVIQKQETATRADLKVGVSVTAARRQGAATVTNVTIGVRGPGGFGFGGGGAGAVVGTISQVQGDNLTIDTSQGPMTVTLATDTIVQRLATGKRDDLVMGANILATGSPSADQSGLTAATVLIMPTAPR